MIVITKCASPKDVCQLMGRYNGRGEKEKGMRCITWLEEV